MDEIVLNLDNISKSFGSTDVLNGLTLDVRRGEFLTMLGPSGCGKTTTLRIVAGLAEADTGRVLLDGIDVTRLPPEKRNVNTVFQHYALFPHMNVFQNIAYGPKLRRVERGVIKRRVSEMLEMVKLPGYEKRMPDQLSGGQQQRVAIARALINDPMLLLLDEPLGALDLNLRRAMQYELKSLQKQLGITFIYITHDQEEALNMSDRVAVMRAGRIDQMGSPDEVYNRPLTRYTAEFIGQSNLFEGTVASVSGGTAVVDTPHGRALAQGEGATPGQSVYVCARTERVRYGVSAPGAGFSLSGRIRERTYVAGVQRTILILEDGKEVSVTGYMPGEDMKPGDEARVYWEPAHATLIPREGVS